MKLLINGKEINTIGGSCEYGKSKAIAGTISFEVGQEDMDKIRRLFREEGLCDNERQEERQDNKKEEIEPTEKTGTATSGAKYYPQGKLNKERTPAKEFADVLKEQTEKEG